MSELAAAKEEVSETPVVESTEPAVAAVVAVEVQSPSKVAAVAAGGEEKEKKALQGADELRSFTNNVTRFEDTHLYVGDATFRCDSLKNVPEEVIYVLEQDLGLTQPSPIQINMGLAIDGRSAIAQAQTGSGKTIAFSMVLLSRIDTTKSELQALVLAPTRELIQQIAGEIATLGSRMKPNKPSIKLAVPDGAPKDKKKGKTTKMKYNEQICCGTPGTVNSWVAKGIINLNALRVFVLDEADSMLVDFTNDVTSLSEMIKVCENKRQGENIAKVQILMFSATYSEEARKIYTRLKLLPEDAARMNIELSNLMIENIYQVRMKVEAGKKLETLRTLYDILSVESSIVFVDTKREVDEVAQLMIDSGNAVSSIHGGFDGNERDSIMEDFRQEKTKFLICTDVLARGVDVPAVSVVVNYSIPRIKSNNGRGPAEPASDTYLHRIGRTGRYGRRGFAITLLETEQDEMDLKKIEDIYSPASRFTKEHGSSIEDIMALLEAISSEKSVTQKAM